MSRPRSRARRMLAAVVVAMVVFAAVLAVTRARSRDDQPAARSHPPPPTPGPSATPLQAPPLQPEEAEALGGEALLAVGLAAARGDWAGLGDPAWPPEEQPVYVGRARLDPARRHVEADVTIGFRPEADGAELVLRLLPASRALADAGSQLDVAVRRDGRPAPHQVEHAGARLLITADPPLVHGAATTLRVRLSYDLPDRRLIAEDGSPAGFGLLAWNPGTTVLGHWLPLLTLPSDAGPPVPWGDVGAFPAAVWSLVVESDRQVVTGGVEGPCPPEVDAGPGCVWVRGVALRDVSAVVYDAPSRRASREGTLVVESLGPPGVAAGLDRALVAATASVRSFQRRFGPLPWTELDVAAAPLVGGASGMEFPGLVIIDPDSYDRMDGGIGAFVVAHEVAHQWFHALVGNGSLSAPVVDESLAQYLAYLMFADTYSEQAAQAVAREEFRGDYQRARAAGLAQEPPAQPLDAFDSAGAYVALVYDRAALGWVEAERAAGREAVVAMLAEVVRRWGLGFVDDEGLVSFAEQRAPAVGRTLRRYWLDPAPVT